MQIHADHAQRVVLDTAKLPWQPSRGAGVERKLLERHGGEEGRAISVVRYAKGVAFPQHAHPGGEEILVLEGTFADERGEYPRGTWLQNPPGSVHAPYSPDGCILLVRLRFAVAGEMEGRVVDTRSAPWYPGMAEGLSVLPLMDSGGVHAALVRWEPGSRFPAHRHYGGEEIYVLSGIFGDEWGSYPQGTWMRSPHLSSHEPFSRSGCTLYVRTGHLDFP